MDEPLSHLDGKARQAMRTEIKRLIHKIKCTTVYVTHDQLEAMSLADKIARHQLRRAPAVRHPRRGV